MQLEQTFACTIGQYNLGCEYCIQMKQDHQALLKYCPQHHAHRKTQKTHVTLTSDL